VSEHLSLICEIKNSKKSEIHETMKETLEITMLTEFRNMPVKHLSGGNKRKLSLALALVSKPKLIILDEPTSGLDVQSRN
jgi:ABC-type multidrug transport system ATPase subunit